MEGMLEEVEGKGEVVDEQSGKQIQAEVGLGWVAPRCHGREFVYLFIRKVRCLHSSRHHIHLTVPPALNDDLQPCP